MAELDPEGPTAFDVTAAAQGGVLDGALRSPELAQARASARAKLFGSSGDPARIDRFLVVKRLGGGGMGVVFAAYDPQLDRKVALKLLRPGWGGDDAAAMQARLLREAQSMARITHPNVITVHEVGTFDGQVFVAMEFVDGRTLGQWLEQGQHSWPALRTVFVAIGRGLSAAHGAGLVHRDFKPDNVMLGEDGRVRVLDFGLAKQLEQAAPGEVDPPAESSLLPRAGAFDLRMTQTGAVLGTPAYMAPEQHRGQVVDARTDQFSFCVALFEAVFGRRPYVGQTYAALAEAVCEGRLDEPTDRGDLPGRAFRAILRGLSPRPGDRFASMDALLEEILHDPTVMRGRVLLGLGGVAVVTGLVVAAGSWGDDTACERAASRLASVWNPDRSKAGRAAFVATDKAYAADAWASVEHGLDAYAEAWAHAHDQACDPSNDAPTEELELGRVLCLEWRAQEVQALTDLFVQADGAIVERAVEAVGAVTPPQMCLTEQALRAVARLPDDPQMRAQVIEARADLARAKGLGDAGRYGQAIAEASAVQASDVAAAYAPLGAEASLRLGRLRRATGDLDGSATSLADAVYAALAGEHDTVALEAAVELLWVFGWDRRQFDAAMPWIRLAEALAHRQSSDPNVSGLDLALGATFDAAGRHREALEYFRTAVERRERDEDDDDAMVEALLWLGRSLASDGDFAGSLSQLQRAQELAPNPAAAARVDIELGELHWKLGHYARAHEHFTRAEASTTALRGAEHASVAIPLAGLARTAWARGEPQRALDAIERILIIERTEAVGDATLVDALEIRAHILAAQKNVAGADRDIDRAVAIARRHGADHPMQAFVFFARAEVHRSQQRWDEALRYLERARELIGPSLGLPDPRRQELAVATGEIYAARGDATRAIDVLERARQALLACCSEHFRLGDAELALAQALAATGDDPTRARELAASARARLVRSGRPQP